MSSKWGLEIWQYYSTGKIPTKVINTKYLLYKAVSFLLTTYLTGSKMISNNHLSKFQGVNGQYAWFCVTPKNVNVYDLNIFPFVWVGQYLQGCRTFQLRTFQLQASIMSSSTMNSSTMNFSTMNFSTMNFSTMNS